MLNQKTINITIYTTILTLLTHTQCQKQTQTTNNIFRYNQSSGITSLDPAFAKDQATMWAINQIFNGLVQMDDNMQIKPCIAHSWKISPDQKTYTFYLKPNIYFHNSPLFPNKKTTTLKASDVVYSFSRLIDTTLASPGAWVFNNKINPKQPFKAINDTTFQLNLIQPFPPMLGILTMQYCSIVPQIIAQATGKQFRKNPIGTGPFQLKTWHENEVLILTKNNNYFEKTPQGKKLPNIDGIKITFIDNKRNEYLKFIDGKLDMISGIDPAYKDDLLTPEGQINPTIKNNITLLRTPYLNTEYFGILQKNNNLKPLNDRRIRQAINYAIDKPKLIRYLRNNIGIPATQGFIPPILPPFKQNPTKGYNYNPQLAANLLQQAGYNTKNPLTQLSIETTTSYQDIAIFVQKQLAEIGIQAKVLLNTGPLLRERAAKQQVPFFRASWIADYPDPENYFTILYGKTPAPPNYTQFNNPTYNHIYEQALKNPNNQNQYYHQLDSIIISEAPIIPLYYDEALRFIQKRVNNLGINGFNMLTLKNVTLNQ